MVEASEPAAGQQNTQTDKRGRGRPLKFSDPVQLQIKVDAYFHNCDSHVVQDHTEWVEARNTDGSLKKDEHGLNYLVQVTHTIRTDPIPYTITGLALHLDTSRETLLDYEEGTYFPDDMPDEVKTNLSDTIKRAKLKCQNYVEQSLEKSSPVGAIFSLKNNYGWRDKSEVEGSGEQRIIIETRKHVANPANGSH